MNALSNNFFSVIGIIKLVNGVAEETKKGQRIQDGVLNRDKAYQLADRNGSQIVRNKELSLATREKKLSSETADAKSTLLAIENKESPPEIANAEPIQPAIGDKGPLIETANAELTSLAIRDKKLPLEISDIESRLLVGDIKLPLPVNGVPTVVDSLSVKVNDKPPLETADEGLPVTAANIILTSAAEVTRARIIFFCLHL